ncbi:unnamed protein product [Brassica rapa subsp. trilocularis]
MEEGLLIAAASNERVNVDWNSPSLRTAPVLMRIVEEKSRCREAGHRGDDDWSSPWLSFNTKRKT